MTDFLQILLLLVCILATVASTMAVVIVAGFFAELTKLVRSMNTAVEKNKNFHPWWMA